ncbi:MAG TPA: hypothetical protein VFP43_04910, partial [Mesorhizobium sp.]|nr:hypothetical protein [Mesorhizobium sp.]
IFDITLDLTFVCFAKRNHTPHAPTFGEDNHKRPISYKADSDHTLFALVLAIIGNDLGCLELEEVYILECYTMFLFVEFRLRIVPLVFHTLTLPIVSAYAKTSRCARVFVDAKNLTSDGWRHNDPH